MPESLVLAPVEASVYYFNLLHIIMDVNFRHWLEYQEQWGHLADDEDVGFQGEFWGAAGSGVLPISQDTGNILIQHRSGQVEQPGTWGVFGGALKGQYMKELESGDQKAFERSAREEFEEEAGPMAQQAQLKPAYIFKKDNFEYRNFIGLVPYESDPKGNWESQGHKWVDWEGLLEIEPKHFGLAALIKNSGSLIKAISKRNAAVSV
jgi:8-oxo-dGTP pyrophosphatase MutT (NUDIX family)